MLIVRIRFIGLQAQYSNCDSPPCKRKRRSTRYAGASRDCEATVAVDVYDCRVSVDYSSGTLTRMNGSTEETTKRQWSFTDADAATSHFIGLLRHASANLVTLTGPVPIWLLQVSVFHCPNREREALSVVTQEYRNVPAFGAQ